jgi:hypothetical protein
MFPTLSVVVSLPMSTVLLQPRAHSAHLKPSITLAWKMLPTALVELLAMMLLPTVSVTALDSVKTALLLVLP